MVGRVVEGEERFQKLGINERNGEENSTIEVKGEKKDERKKKIMTV